MKAYFIKKLEMIKKMNKDRTKKWVPCRLLECAACVVLLAGFYRLVGCPIRLLTGVSCAGCGMTRACLCALRLDFRQAFYFHPLFPLVPAGAALWLCRKKLPRAFFYGCMYTLLGIFVIVYIYRLFRGDGSVVVFDPRSGLIFRVVSQFKGGI